MTVEYNPKIIEESAQKSGLKKEGLKQNLIIEKNIIVFQCFHIHLGNCTWGM